MKNSKRLMSIYGNEFEGASVKVVILLYEKFSDTLVNRGIRVG